MTGLAFHTVSIGLTRQVKLLLRSGLNVNIKNDKGQNLLVAALKIENPEKRYRMFRMLLTKGVNMFSVDPSTGRDVLIWACALNRHREMALVLAEGTSGLDLCRRDGRGFTCLHYAAMSGNKDTCKLLCEAIHRVGLSVDIPNNQGFTPFILAKRLGHGHCIAVLLKVGHASPHQFDNVHYKMAENWGHQGRKERTSVDRKLVAQRIIALKTLGRMPQLHDANYQPSDVKIVASKQEKSLMSKMYAKTYERPWSAPNSAEKRDPDKKDHLKWHLLKLYETEALGDGPAGHVVGKAGLTTNHGANSHIKAERAGQDRQATKLATSPAQNSRSLPDISVLRTKTESDLFKNQKSSVAGTGRPPPNNPWYPPSKITRVNLRNREKSDLDNHKVDDAVAKGKTSISQLLGVMAEQNTHSFRSAKRLSGVTPTVHVSVTSQQTGGNKKGGNPHPGKWKGKSKIDMGSASLDVIREEH